MKKVHIGLMALVLTLGACGGTPADVESSEKTLVPSQIYQSVPGGDGVFQQFHYTCGNRVWYMRQPVYQVLTANTYYTRLDSYGNSSGINRFLNEVKIACDDPLIMTNYSTEMDALGSTVCNVYAHPAGQLVNWELSVSGMTIPPWGNLIYYPIRPGYAYGSWWVGMQLPSSLSQIGTGYGVTGCATGGDVNHLGGYWNTSI